MSITEITDSGTLVVPGAYPSVKVTQTPSGLGPTGILFLMGEADAGPHYSEESDLTANAFGPDQTADVLAKYKSGPVCDAFVNAVAAANDPNIVGSLSKCFILKTNRPTRASATIPAIGGGTWATLKDRSSGKLGNLITRTITKTVSEALPTTGSAILAPPQVSTDVSFRVNGGAAAVVTISGGTAPPTMVSQIDGVAGVAATGGTSRAVITAVAGSITLTVDSGRQVHLVITTAWANAPTVGDILYIPTGSPFAAANEGTYVVTASTTTRIDAYKLLDAAGAGGALTNPSTETVAVAATSDVNAYAPVVITLEAGAVVPGLGKSLEIANSGSANFSAIAFTFAGATASPPGAAATWVSTSTTPYALPAAAEYAVNLQLARQVDSVSEDLAFTSEVVFTLGYKGTSGSAVIAADGTCTVTVVGGSGTSPAVFNLRDFATLNDLAQYFSTLTGFAASAATAQLGSIASTALDIGTYTIGSTQGAKVGRIKADGQRYTDKINANAVLGTVALVAPATKFVGLPDVAAMAFLTGGAKGGTVDADVSGALVQAESLQGNFVVPLFSRDATADIADGLTDSTSTYTIASVNANVKSHCIAVSTQKRRRHRQGFCSFRGTYADAKLAAGAMASARVALAFQDVKAVTATGSITQFQPWMTAVKAAGMQAAGFYRPLVHKFVNVSGVLQAAGDFNDTLDSKVEDALLSGLLVLRKGDQGGVLFVSDQTTYLKDDNFVFNSIQAMYVTDTVALNTARRMETAFVGQSVADISAALALTTLETILSDMRRLKLLSPSDDAPKGFSKGQIRIVGPAMRVAVEIKIAGAILFIPIAFNVTPVVQAAG